MGRPDPVHGVERATLADHVIDESLWVAPLLAGHGLEAANEIVEGAKASARGDRISLWRTASTNAATAWTEPGAMDRTVALSWGPTPALPIWTRCCSTSRCARGILARRSGCLDPLPEDQVGYVLGVVEAFGDLAATGAFTPPVPVDAAGCRPPRPSSSRSPGRRPRWSDPAPPDSLAALRILRCVESIPTGGSS